MVQIFMKSYKIREPPEVVDFEQEKIKKIIYHCQCPRHLKKCGRLLYSHTYSNYMFVRPFRRILNIDTIQSYVSQDFKYL
jgi:hypothetical protein